LHNPASNKQTSNVDEIPASLVEVIIKIIIIIIIIITVLGSEG